MSTNGAADAVRGTIYKSCILLDGEKWNDWLALCDNSFEYTITAYSPEISQDMKYFGGSRSELETMLNMLEKHNTDHSPLTRHTTVYTVDVDDDGKSATAVSSFVIYQNRLDGVNSHIDAGESHLFLVGKYLDKFKIEDGKPYFTEREVRLDTRRLDKGSHWVL